MSCSANSNTNSNTNNSMTQGRGPEMKYDFYFPENACMFMSSNDISKCRKIPYPLENIPACSMPCLKVPDKSIFGDPVPSELYGNALGMDGGDGLYYYHDPNAPKSLSVLTYPSRVQPYHFAYNPATQ